MRGKWIHVGVIIAVGLALTAPALALGFPPLSHDGSYHAVWSSWFTRQLWGGDPYPRWLHGMNAGLGSPVFFFYAPVPYYVTGLLALALGNPPEAWWPLGLSASLAVVASGVSAYLWLSTLVSRRWALVASALYVALPYHLAVDLYIRGAFAELWTFVWMPLIMYFTGRLLRGEPYAHAGLAVSYALLVTTHLLTTLVFSAVPVLYVLSMADARERLRAFVSASASLALGAGLSAVYVVPAMTTQAWVGNGPMNNYAGYESRFLFAEAAGFSRNVSLVTLVTALLAGCAAVVAIRGSSGRARREAIFWTIVTLGSVFMMTTASAPLWRYVSPLRTVQFPWRFNTALAVATAALLALGIAALRRPVGWANGALLAGALALIAAWAPVTAWGLWTSYSTSSPDRQEALEKARERVRLGMDVSEYVPAWVEPRTQDNLRELLRQYRGPGGDAPQARVLDGRGTATVERWRPGDLVLRTDTPEDATVLVRQFYYPPWGARVADQECCLQTQPWGPEGLLAVSVPAGVHEVQVFWRPGGAEYAGRIVSAVSLAGLLALLGWSAVRGGRWGGLAPLQA